jgi:hypothetical protein
MLLSHRACAIKITPASSRCVRRGFPARSGRR